MGNISILELRKQTGLSQSEFAEKFHLSVKSVQAWEQGKRIPPDDTLCVIQKILECEEEIKNYLRNNA